MKTGSNQNRKLKNPKMTFETTNFALHLGKKGGKHYLALQDKRTLATMVQTFRTKKKAEHAFHKMSERPEPKTVNADGKE